jgi:hypothetical protein
MEGRFGLCHLPCSFENAATNVYTLIAGSAKEETWTEI